MKTIKVKKNQSFATQLFILGACCEARFWVHRKSLKTAWKTCERPDWMIWLINKTLAGEVGKHLTFGYNCNSLREAFPYETIQTAINQKLI